MQAQPNRHLGEGLVEAFHETSHIREEKGIVDSLPVETTVTTTTTSITAVAEPPPVIEVLPLPGFVIKTHRDNGKKVFINVYHHEDVVDDDQTLLASFPVEVLPVIYHHYHEKDEIWALYEVVVSSCYFTSPQTEITSALAVQKVLFYPLCCSSGVYPVVTCFLIDLGLLKWDL